MAGLKKNSFKESYRGNASDTGYHQSYWLKSLKQIFSDVKIVGISTTVLRKHSGSLSDTILRKRSEVLSNIISF